MTWGSSVDDWHDDVASAQAEPNETGERPNETWTLSEWFDDFMDSPTKNLAGKGPKHVQQPVPKDTNRAA